jgi:hypothetical protein
MFAVPYADGPIPDLPGELTDELPAISTGSRAVDCYYCGAPLICPGLGLLVVGPADLPPARRTARKRDIKFGDASGVATWRLGIEQALRDEANNPHRDPRLPAITHTQMVNKFGKQAFEGYLWAYNRYASAA